MKNKDKYREQIIEIAMNGDSLAVDKNTKQPISCHPYCCQYCLFGKCVRCREAKKEWMDQEVEILDEIEKTYLRNVIKPFKERVAYIRKNEYNSKAQYISIIYSERKDLIADNGWDNIILPSFPKETMYKGMEVNKRYTLEELGL